MIISITLSENEIGFKTLHIVPPLIQSQLHRTVTEDTGMKLFLRDKHFLSVL